MSRIRDNGPQRVKRVEKTSFFTQCTFSQSYFMLLKNKTYQLEPQSLLIN